MVRLLSCTHARELNKPHEFGYYNIIFAKHFADMDQYLKQKLKQSSAVEIKPSAGKSGEQVLVRSKTLA